MLYGSSQESFTQILEYIGVLAAACRKMIDNINIEACTNMIKVYDTYCKHLETDVRDENIIGLPDLGDIIIGLPAEKSSYQTWQIFLVPEIFPFPMVWTTQRVSG